MMMTELTVITTFLGWCAVINILVLGFSAMAVLTLKSWIVDIHQRMFGLDEDALNAQYFRYLANFKIVTVTFFVVPYLALKIMTM